MDSFADFIEVQTPDDFPPAPPNLRPDMGKAGGTNQLGLPMLMRRNTATSSFSRYELPNSKINPLTGKPWSGKPPKAMPQYKSPWAPKRK